MIHGLAGSGALMLLVLSTISSAVVGIFYVLVFGIGSIGGMMLMSLLLSLPFKLSARFDNFNRAVRVLAAVLTVSLGLLMAYQTATVQEFHAH